MRQPFNVKQVMKLMTDSMIRYKSKWAAAGMALILGAGSIGISFLYHPAEKAAGIYLYGQYSGKWTDVRKQSVKIVFPDDSITDAGRSIAGESTVSISLVRV